MFHIQAKCAATESVRRHDLHASARRPIVVPKGCLEPRRTGNLNGKGIDRNAESSSFIDNPIAITLPLYANPQPIFCLIDVGKGDTSIVWERSHPRPPIHELTITESTLPDRDSPSDLSSNGRISYPSGEGRDRGFSLRYIDQVNREPSVLGWEESAETSRSFIGQSSERLVQRNYAGCSGGAGDRVIRAAQPRG